VAKIGDMHWHDLRHSFASRLVMSGVDLRTVQELMGHKTIAMTVRYSHLACTHLQEAVERLSDRRTDTTTDTDGHSENKMAS
jgi:site-specific recombinase XerD